MYHATVNLQVLVYEVMQDFYHKYIYIYIHGNIICVYMYISIYIYTQSQVPQIRL